jgi:ribulose-5-phosphate 4-epimerase/fuculose-1-phosphate aldolase
VLDEGYIKYESQWTLAPATYPATARQLEQWRVPLFAAGLIGHYPDLDIGYGNISLRARDAGQFLITGTQTGHLESTNEAHYSLVTAYDLERNRVTCTGPLQASSEAMTHASIYDLDPSIAAVVHVHSKALWDKFRLHLPTTSAEVAYGTPEMALEFRRLHEETLFATQGLAVMGGHEEGLISIGDSIEQAATRVLSLLDRL